MAGGSGRTPQAGGLLQVVVLGSSTISVTTDGEMWLRHMMAYQSELIPPAAGLGHLLHIALERLA